MGPAPQQVRDDAPLQPAKTAPEATGQKTLDPATSAPSAHSDQSLPSTLLTDRQAYRPGEAISFRAECMSASTTSARPRGRAVAMTGIVDGAISVILVI